MSGTWVNCLSRSLPCKLYGMYPRPKKQRTTPAAGLLDGQTSREMPRTIATGGNLRLGLLIPAALPRMACSPRLPRRRRRDFVPRHPSRASSKSFFAARVESPGSRVSQPAQSVQGEGCSLAVRWFLDHFPVATNGRCLLPRRM